MKRILMGQSWQFFVETAESRSFRTVAQHHGLAPSTLTRRLSQLESHIGGPLFERSHAGLKLTSLGVKAYQEAAPLIESLTKEYPSFIGNTPSQLILRLDPQVSLQSVLRAISAYLRRHQRTNLVVERLDSMNCSDTIAGTSEMITVRVEKSTSMRAGIRRFLAASPQYADEVHLPVVAADLQNHRLLAVSEDTVSLFFGSNGTVEENYPAKVTMSLPDYDSLLEAVRQGSGIGVVQDSDTVRRYFADGSLTRILPDFRSTSLVVKCQGTCAILKELISIGLLDGHHQMS